MSTDVNGSTTNPSGSIGSNSSSQPTEFTDIQKHQLRHRELFLTRQIETLLATNIRGKCLVTLHNETESFLSYLNTEVCLEIHLIEFHKKIETNDDLYFSRIYSFINLFMIQIKNH
jgi:hypothetical protein